MTTPTRSTTPATCRPCSALVTRSLSRSGSPTTILGENPKPWRFWPNSNSASSHNDLGPTNLIVNGNRIVVLDWEMAGYAPLEWVRTKFAICGALCVERVSSAGIERNSEYPVEPKL
ncbi:hypothetical protein BT67DRAFT_445025 [Trichocladium antarcticum]|uniref:Aminoglycoside phosphotransferase domain-containing protein n=1 Tax=Trichocladium antarcticum TaxID=1450529 RepID=A0AAN6UDI7_9PEZI|nr:hypothetical protein BT67DRAFT_445025 [Trichocladium antarcticum]